MPFQKKVWQFNDIITEGELNRMEQGIEDSITAIEGHKNDQNNPHNVTAEQIGAETPAGAQEKANQAEANANNYTDQEVTKIANNLASHKNDNTPHREAVSIERKNPDDDGIFKLIVFRRSDGTLFKTSQLNGTSPYNSRTVKYYDKNENLIQTVEYSITYLNDEVVSEVIISA